ncbi:MAG: helix-turn-helix transcriptional regulator, partial [Clostridia bacterium]|nr:helix-turn-helix transcriptional regulator [Clostridia bacterium]
MNFLKTLRTNAGKLQKEVAAYLGVDRTTYLRYEKGESEPDYETLKKLADYFDVSIDYLLGRETKKDP